MMAGDGGLFSRLEPRWLTIPEAAEYTRTDEAWILSHIKSGTLKYVPTARRVKDTPKGPRRRIVDRLMLDALMEMLEVREVPPPPPADGAPARAVVPPAVTRGMGLKERLKRNL